jgi:hypothetical protein
MRLHGFHTLVALFALTWALGPLAPVRAAPGGRAGSASSHSSGSSSHSSGSSYHGSSGSSYHGSSYRGSSANRAAHAAGGGWALHCAHGDDCTQDWWVAIGFGVVACLGTVGFLYFRAQKKPQALYLSSLLLALDGSGESIKGRFDQLARRSKRKRRDALCLLAQRSCALLTEYRDAWTHAGSYPQLSVADAAAFAQIANELWSRDVEFERQYPGAASYTVVVLLFASHEPLPALMGTSGAEVDAQLRALAQLHPREFEVMWLPSQDRCLTLYELNERYPELGLLDTPANAVRWG